MTATTATRDLFSEIRKLIQGIPESVTEMDIYLRMDSVPVIVCKTLVLKNGLVEDGHKTFHITERNGGEA